MGTNIQGSNFRPEVGHGSGRQGACDPVSGVLSCSCYNDRDLSLKVC